MLESPKIVITRLAFERIQEAIYLDREEQCGLLLGSRSKESGTVAEDLYVAPNLRRSPTSFAIGRVAYALAAEEAASRNLSIQAIFHTHLGTDVLPSRADLYHIVHSSLPWVIGGRIRRRGNEVDGGVKLAAFLPRSARAMELYFASGASQRLL